MLVHELQELRNRILSISKPWHEKCSLIYKYHKERERKSVGWAVKDTAEDLDYIENYIYDSIQLAKYLEKFEDLRLFTSRKVALTVIRNGEKISKQIERRQKEINEKELVVSDV